MNVTEHPGTRSVARREGRIVLMHDGVDTPHSSKRMLRISIKQWRLFQAVVDNDGFVGAANKLNISQSSISHALAKLQNQLGVSLLLIRGRKAYITEEGKMLLARSRDLVRQAEQLEELGEFMRLGREPEVRIAVEPHYPVDLLMRAFYNLNRQSYKPRLEIREVGLATLGQLLNQDKVDLGVSTATLPGFVSNKLIEIEHVAVAHADSPLFSTGRAISNSELNDYFQIIFRTVDNETGHYGVDEGIEGQRAWRVSSLDSAAEALQFGMGYAWLPRYRVQRWLDDGWARIIPLDCGHSYTMQIHLIRGRNVVPGSGAQRFAEALQAATNDYPALQGAGDNCGQASAGKHDTTCSCRRSP